VIASLSGDIFSKNLRVVIVSVSGVGYRVQMPLSDISKLGEVGETIFLHIHTHVREDALDLYGFLSEDSLVLFEQLISVSGIGPKLALTLLSGMDSRQLAQTLVNGDHLALTHVPGIGQKTAQRLVLELKDRLKSGASIASLPTSGSSHLLSDLRSAILNLGYKSQTVERAVKSVEALANQGQTLEVLVKEALKQLN